MEQFKANVDQSTQAYTRVGWLSEDAEILALINDGEEEFYKNIAVRILAAHSDEVIINNCPACGRLARTPSATQCRHCGYLWR